MLRLLTKTTQNYEKPISSDNFLDKANNKMFLEMFLVSYASVLKLGSVGSWCTRAGMVKLENH